MVICEGDATDGGARVPESFVELRNGHESVEDELSGEVDVGLNVVILLKEELPEAV